MFKPLNDLVLIQPIREGNQTTGGLWKPDMAEGKPVEGMVIAVGTGRREFGRLIEMDVKAGDRVSFGKYAGSEIQIEGDTFLIMREEEILGVIDTTSPMESNSIDGGEAAQAVPVQECPAENDE